MLKYSQTVSFYLKGLCRKLPSKSESDIKNGKYKKFWKTFHIFFFNEFNFFFILKTLILILYKVSSYFIRTSAVKNKYINQEL